LDAAFSGYTWSYAQGSPKRAVDLALWWVTEWVVFTVFTVVDGARWIENRDDRKKKSSSELLFFFRVFGQETTSDR
jgi:hypothetical protein